MNQDSHFSEGILLGGLLGAAIGLMFAPFAGDRTRALVREKLKDLELDDIIDRFQEAFEEGKQEAAEVAKETEK